MTGPVVQPYGSWPTPITSEVVVAEAIGLSEVRVDGPDVIWGESRPAEGGRIALVRRGGDGRVLELLPAGVNARTAVHEYGGGAWWVHEGGVWFVDWADQRIYRRDPDSGEVRALTPEPLLPRGDRYADGAVSPDGEWIVCVRERHPPDGRGAADVRNEIVRLLAHRPSEPEVLVGGPDFVSNPRFSPDGQRLSWVEWDHPDMPWDATRLMVRQLESGQQSQLAGGPGESIAEPTWLGADELAFISDRNGWWNLYRQPADGSGEAQALVQIEAEIGEPQWVFGSARYAVLGDGRIVFARWRDGFDALALRRCDGTVVELDLPFTLVRNLRAAGPSTVVAVAASPVVEKAVVRIHLDDRDRVAQLETIRAARHLEDLGVGSEHISCPVPISFPSADGRTAFALLYEPANPDCRGPADERPPLLVEIHGGPTGCARPELDLSVQYWTSRGFAVVDVNYGGSTGYGRPFRELLRDAWGVVDVEDCLAAASWLAGQGRVDGQRMAIRGGSAGGYTTLAALARPDTPFAAGADYFGVADLEVLAVETHKFESRYLDSLVGPYPQARQIYLERSPLRQVDSFSRPLIVLQGLEDEIVPPNQATMIVDALKAKGVPVAYVPFEGEQHGFRRAASIRRALDSELSFYAQLFGFELPAGEAIEPVEIYRGASGPYRAVQP
jgi:dipeptidyl aminopeptidase/acylaminoacyl peptidase